MKQSLIQTINPLSFRVLSSSLLPLPPQSINSLLPPSPAASSPSRSAPQKGPIPSNDQVSLSRVIVRNCMETLTSAAAMVVSSALVSYAGATSTISAETMCRPSRPRKMVRNSRVDQPPVSGVPVAGANAGSIESICISRDAKLRNTPHTVQISGFCRRHLQSASSEPESGKVTHINGEIDRLVANCLADLLDDPRRTCVMKSDQPCLISILDLLLPPTDSVNLAGLDTLEPRLVVVHIVRRAGECRADRAVL